MLLLALTLLQTPQPSKPTIVRSTLTNEAPATKAQTTTSVTQHEYILHNFHTELGPTIPELHLIYGTYGTLDPQKSNAILLPSHYMADMNGYNWLIGPGNALHPETSDFLITSELFGNGRSSSPSNTPPPYDGPRFPVLTIRDNVNAVHQMLTDQLKISHLRAVIGFSMGAQQAFQWAVSYPTYMDRIVATSGTAKTYGHGFARNESQIQAITADPAFLHGDYKSPPTAGLETFNTAWLAWLFGQEYWRQELWKSDFPPGTTVLQVIDHYRHDFIHGDANNLILQLHTWESNDAGATPGMHGSIEQALKSIQVPVLYMPSATDLYFPLTDAQFEAQYIPHCTLLPIPSVYGHPAGAGASPADKLFLNQHIAAFLTEPKP